MKKKNLRRSLNPKKLKKFPLLRVKMKNNLELNKLNLSKKKKSQELKSQKLNKQKLRSQRFRR